MEHCNPAISDLDGLQHGEISTIMVINLGPSVYVNEMDDVHLNHENSPVVEGISGVV